MSRSLEELAIWVVELAKSRGATGSECTASEGNHFSVGVRLGEVETLTEAGSRAIGVRLLVGQHTGSAYTSDLTDDGLSAMVDSALELAKITTEDPFAGLPDAALLGKIDIDLQLFSEDLASLTTDWKIDQARAAEAAALAFDERIANSEGGSFDSTTGTRAFANSLGFSGSYGSGSCSLSAVPVAKQGDAMERDYWHTSARSAAKLESAESVGRRAAERAVRRLGARKVATQKAPIILEPRIARSLVGHLFDAVNGDAVHRGETFLASKLGEQIATSKLTLIDDATIPGLFGSSPFDDEGIPSRRTVVIENGVLRSFLHNSYTARKMGTSTTGNASRGITGNAGVGHGNLYVPAGDLSPEEIIGSVKSGFYVTEVMGFGVNVVTGDYSRGAAGMWIEDGHLAYPVSEVTIASTLPDMLLGLEAIGSDLEFRGSMACPTILFGEMTISGQ